jgi:hypothetical protein
MPSEFSKKFREASLEESTDEVFGGGVATKGRQAHALDCRWLAPIADHPLSIALGTGRYSVISLMRRGGESVSKTTTTSEAG